jgi:hypothetical protein
MSYDLAVWEGERPADDQAAFAQYKECVERYLEGGVAVPVPPTDRIRGYVEALLAVYPDLTDDEDDGSPWSTGPLLSEANGSFIYFPMTWSRCAEVSEVSARIALAHGLVCFDPQLERLRPVVEPTS